MRQPRLEWVFFYERPNLLQIEVLAHCGGSGLEELVIVHFPLLNLEIVLLFSLASFYHLISPVLVVEHAIHVATHNFAPECFFLTC